MFLNTQDLLTLNYFPKKKAFIIAVVVSVSSHDAVLIFILFYKGYPNEKWTQSVEISILLQL